MIQDDQTVSSPVLLIVMRCISDSAKGLKFLLTIILVTFLPFDAEVSVRAARYDHIGRTTSRIQQRNRNSPTEQLAGDVFSLGPATFLPTEILYPIHSLCNSASSKCLLKSRSRAGSVDESKKYSA